MEIGIRGYDMPGTREAREQIREPGLHRTPVQPVSQRRGGMVRYSLFPFTVAKESQSSLLARMLPGAVLMAVLCTNLPSGCCAQDADRDTAVATTEDGAYGCADTLSRGLPAPEGVRRYPWRTGEATEPLFRRISPPTGCQRRALEAGSFGEWLRGLPLKPGRPAVMCFDGRPKANQDAHLAVVAMDVGSRDLQQCADALIRLRAEYLWSSGCADSVSFRFTSGDTATWRAWKGGHRPVVTATTVVWARTAPADDTYASFRRYLETVFIYAGSASLAAELAPVADPSHPEIGDVFIQGGHPGHAVLVVDVAEDQSGQRWFLLAQSYMPAQEMHVLRNPHSDSCPWYRAQTRGPLETPEWTFRHENLRRFATVVCP